MYLFGFTFVRSLQQLEFAKESALLSKEKLCIGLSMFEMVLSKLRTFLDQDKEVWEKEEPAPEHSVMEVRYICKLRFCFHVHVIANSSFMARLYRTSFCLLSGGQKPKLSPPLESHAVYLLYPDGREPA